MTTSSRRGRDPVLQAIAEVFRRHGYERASLSRLTAATGLGKGSLYNFFPHGKEQMAAEVLAHIQRWFEAEIFVPLKETEDPWAGIERMFRSTEQYFQSGQKICLMGLMALDEETPFGTQIRAYFSDWQIALASAAHKSGKPQEEANDLAEEIVSGIQGALVLAHAQSDAGIFLRRMQSFRRRLAFPCGGLQSETPGCLQGR
ncbi:TetR/AcrR family transcriptional regulator [Gluconobacter thailandicus]|uniref:TetR/AcrR family transcriptional regulator n=1 Tax=Gluconobacter thailandicus TaxID=257438 RepID=UPI000690A70B|nr:TetR/AcrR family transcriptional regulator [Gluconobacter thailandicus]KXV52389.1 hypothetical protein AD946_13670 [Gluconobacter thailandicus]GBR60506.1 transcriptional regulator [Gluconobacter thailandicus F149-1 = NBRC 100600]